MQFTNEELEELIRKQMAAEDAVLQKGMYLSKLIRKKRIEEIKQ